MQTLEGAILAVILGVIGLECSGGTVNPTDASPFGQYVVPRVAGIEPRSACSHARRTCVSSRSPSH
jgi:hypothetical protein